MRCKQLVQALGYAMMTGKRAGIVLILQSVGEGYTTLAKIKRGDLVLWTVD